jgi:hypothetical protein
MSKFSGRFNYKTWLILKHGLRNSINQKEKELKILSPDSYEEAQEYKKLEKDIKEEKKALKKVSDFINIIKERINIHKKSNIAVCIDAFSVRLVDKDIDVSEGDFVEVISIYDLTVEISREGKILTISRTAFEFHFRMLEE